MNTEKAAQAIAGELKVEARRVTEVKPADLDGFELIGFGSGINAFDVHPEMHALVDGLGEAKGRKAFPFSTCASRKVWTGKLREKLGAKGFSVVDEFCCAGLWKAGLVQTSGTLNTGNEFFWCSSERRDLTRRSTPRG
jgi:flavodoxin